MKNDDDTGGGGEMAAGTSATTMSRSDELSRYLTNSRRNLNPTLSTPQVVVDRVGHGSGVTTRLLPATSSTIATPSGTKLAPRQNPAVVLNSGGRDGGANGNRRSMRSSFRTKYSESIQEESLDRSIERDEQVDENSKPKKKKKGAAVRKRPKTKWYITIIKLMFSTIGLVLVVFLYSVLGALMFQLLEQHEELRLCEEGKAKFEKDTHKFRETIMYYIIYNTTGDESTRLTSSSLSNSVNLTNQTILTTTTTNPTTLATPVLDLESPQDTVDNKYGRINQILVDYRNLVLDIESTYRYSGQNCTEDSKWNFYSSLLFTITIISTIGYGFIAPQTWEGRLVCICYASIGIPLTLICLANLSGALGKMFIYIYSKLDSLNPVTRYYKRMLKERKARRREARRKRRMLKRGTSASSRLTSSTGGGGTLTATVTGTSLNRYAYRGVGENNETAGAMAGPLGTNVHYLSARDKETSVFGTTMDSSDYEHDLLFDEHVDLDADDDDDDDDDDENDDIDGEFWRTQNTNEVPMLVTLLVIFIYIYGGAYLFTK